jgi:hypothetical protein
LAALFLLRKAAVAWNVSVYIEALNGAIIKNDECSQDNKVKSLRTSSRGPRTTKAYFYYDIPAASTKHIGIVLDLDGARDEEVLQVRIKRIAATEFGQAVHGFRSTFTENDSRNGYPLIKRFIQTMRELTNIFPNFMYKFAWFLAIMTRFFFIYRGRDLLKYKNAIIIFSDGEINAGTQEPSKLVHEVRENVRQLSHGLDESLNQWVSNKKKTCHDCVNQTMLFQL